MKRLLLACPSAIALGACATDLTPREAKVAHAEAYTEHPLAGDRYRIDYRIEGGGHRHAYDLALRRAAQIALEEGYPAFEIVSDDSAMIDRASPAATLARPRDCGLIGCPKPAVPMESSEPGASNDKQSRSRVVSLEILLTRDSPDGLANRYDAAEVVSATGLHARG